MDPNMREKGLDSIMIPTQIKNSKLVQQKRRRLIKAATKIFLKKGYDKTSLRDISRKSGLTMGNIYNYINKKEDILYLVHQDTMRVYGKLLDRLTLRNAISGEELQEMIKDALERTFEIKEEILLLYRETGSLGHELMKSSLNLELEHVKIFKELFDEGNKKGICNVDDTYFAANLLMYLFAFFPLRGWSLRGYDRGTVIKLIMNYIRKILQSPPIKGG